MFRAAAVPDDRASASYDTAAELDRLREWMDSFRVPDVTAPPHASAGVDPMRPLDGTDVQLSTLRIGRKLGTGGQGTVYELQGQYAGHVYKEYLAPNVNGTSLAQLVAVPGSLSNSERDRLMRQSAWPQARVLDGPQVKGFIMRKVPAEFWGRTTAGSRLREIQYLLYPPKPLWGDIVPLEADGRLEIVRQAAALFFLLHSKSLVVGDISMSTLLWTPTPVGLFLLDCDGIRRLGAPPVLPQTETPDWGDPHQPSSGPDLDTDRYKLALLVARVLTRNSRLRPGQSGSLDFVPGLPERVIREVAAKFAEAARPRGLRPDAGQWVLALSDRGTIELPPVRTLPNLPKAPIEGKRGVDPTKVAGYHGPIVCEVAGITYRQLDYWTRTGLVQTSLRAADDAGGQPLYTFRDILALKAVKWLLDTGVSLQQIRTAMTHLYTRDTPDLAQITIMSDGERIYVCTSPDEVVDLVQAGHGIFGIALGNFWREIEQHLTGMPHERVVAPADSGSTTSSADSADHRRNSA